MLNYHDLIFQRVKNRHVFNKLPKNRYMYDFSQM